MSGELEAALSRCYLLAGGDPDGMPRDPSELARRAVAVVSDLRECYDDALQYVPSYTITPAGREHLDGKASGE